jgi:hypothetical protein
MRPGVCPPRSGLVAKRRGLLFGRSQLHEEILTGERHGEKLLEPCPQPL